MKTVERIFIAIALTGFAFRALHLPFGSLLLITGLCGVTIMYMYLTLPLLHGVRLREMLKKEAYEPTSPKRMLGSILSGVSLALTLMGVLFYLQFWPHYHLHLYVGVVGLCIAIIVAASRYTASNSFYRRLYQRIIPVAFIGLAAVFVPNFLWFEYSYKAHPEYIEAVRALQNDPNNAELQERVEAAREAMWPSK
jgi:glucan phosphoethanolaminetransferase (alkaline phosphatase superfamily)